MHLRSRFITAGFAGLLATATYLGMTALPAQAAGFPTHFAAPYVQIGSESKGDMASDMAATGLKYYTLAFLIPKSSSSCTPMWEDGNNAMNTYVSQVQTIENAGGRVAISFGGAAGGELAETCTSVSSLAAAYEAVVTAYSCYRLDFDIEGDDLNNTAANARRDQALAQVQAWNSSVQVDYTLPVDPTGLESNAKNLLKDAKTKGVTVSIVNIMTMDFGDGQNALNDAESAANATNGQLDTIWGTTSAWGKMGLTPIAGKNDDNENFTQANATTLETFAAGKGIRELAFWEVHEYDKPLGYAYSKIFNKITG
jgi:chitinase